MEIIVPVVMFPPGKLVSLGKVLEGGVPPKNELYQV